MDSSALSSIKRVTGAFEAYTITQYKLYRTKRDGGVQSVTVEVLDAGPEERNRYHVFARSDDGKTATGNPAETLHTALAIVHWGNLG